MVACVEDTQVDAFARHVLDHYLASSGIEAHAYPVQAASGAGLLSF